MQLIVPRLRKSLAIPAYWNCISQTSRQTKKIHGVCLNRNWARYSPDGMVASIYKEDDWIQVEKTILRRLIRDSQYLSRIFKMHKKYGMILETFSHKVLQYTSDRESIQFWFSRYKNIRNLWLTFDQYNVLPWFCGADILRDYIFTELKKHYVTFTEKELHILITTPILSFSSEEELEMCSVVIEMKKKNFIRKLQHNPLHKLEGDLPSWVRYRVQSLVNKYYWIPFGYDGPMVYTVHSYLQSLRSLSLSPFENIQEKVRLLRGYRDTMIAAQKEIISRYSLSSDMVALCKKMHILSQMTDDRKKFEYQSHVAFNHIIVSLARKLFLPVEIFKYVTLEEVKKNLHRKEKLILIYNIRRKNTVYYNVRLNKVCIVDDFKKTQKYDKKMYPDFSNQKSVQGNVVSSTEKKIIPGRVRVLFSPAEIVDFHEGEILVTPMTTPEFVPAMRRAKAIITDEGGVTCHAAIVSRELKKPCIIATKFATKILKNNDSVEIDMKSGKIKIIKRK